MEATASTKVVCQVRRVVLLQDGAGLTDGRLLDFFRRSACDSVPADRFHNAGGKPK
ncbi:hypothetical protein FRUB_06878 [Fimbriiglobus ruber]|uniref:Uncharacterized protein n=1 Tax=Fimbriiglobus ruber TaxID=1908690 RepID=A0A225DGU1_9BACT|nr:hypothetical protein FRUB_06878 [Fimbriiglobus ruber]